MNEIKKLWDELKSMLHHGPSMQPLWQAVMDKLGNFESRIAAMETGLKDKINELLAETETLLFSNIDKAMQAEFKSLVAGYEANIAALEDRLAALEGHPALSIPALTQSGGQLPPPMATTSIIGTIQPAASPVLEPVVVPTEIVVQPEQPAAASATDSPAPAIKPDSPSGTNLTGESGDLTQGDYHGE